jgi:hypothetical protein
MVESVQWAIVRKYEALAESREQAVAEDQISSEIGNGLV